MEGVYKKYTPSWRVYIFYIHPPFLISAFLKCCLLLNMLWYVEKRCCLPLSMLWSVEEMCRLLLNSGVQKSMPRLQSNTIQKTKNRAASKHACTFKPL